MTKNLEKDINLKEYEKKNLENLRKYMKQEHNIDNIDNEKIASIIKKINDADKSESWKDNKLYAIKNYFKQIGRRTTMLSKVAIKHTKDMKKEEKDGKQTEKEKNNYLTYDELNELLKKNEKYNNNDEMNRYLILASICTDQPPLRPQIYADAKIIYKEKELNDKDNFLYINKKKKTGYMYINHDKVTESIKFKNEKKIPLYDRFCEIVIKSLEKTPRDNLYILDVKNKEKKMLLELQKTTGLKFTFDMARSSFITEWHKKHQNASENEIEKLATHMRHSIDTHRVHYKKVDPVSGNLNKKNICEKNTNSDSDKSETIVDKYKKNAVYDLIYKLNKRREDGKEHEIKDETLKKYNIIKTEDGKYKKPDKVSKKKEKIKATPKEITDPKQYNKRRSDIISYANKHQSNIKESTILFYKIKYDHKNKKWI